MKYFSIVVCLIFKSLLKGLVKALIIQSLMRLKEDTVLLRCREMDVSVVNSVLDEAKREYAKKLGLAVPNVIVDKVYLPPPLPDNRNSIGPSWLVNCNLFCKGF